MCVCSALFIYVVLRRFNNIKALGDYLAKNKSKKNEKVILVNKLLEAVKVEKLEESSLAVLESKIKDDSIQKRCCSFCTII